MSGAIYEKKRETKDFFIYFSLDYLYYPLLRDIFAIFVCKFEQMKYLLVFFGSVSLLLGVLGIFLPVLPTTPFLLLSAALYLRSSRRLYDWLMSHRHLGPYIRNFQEHKAIPLRVKIVSVSLVWATLIYCAVCVAWVWWMRIVFIVIAVGVSAHILHYKTLK